MKKHTKTPRQLLLSVCIFGGNRKDINDLLARFKYSAEDLQAAIDVLNESTSSAIEVSEAKDNADFLKRIMTGMKLGKKFSNKKR